jgi:hypothetical protein
MRIAGWYSIADQFAPTTGNAELPRLKVQRRFGDTEQNSAFRGLSDYFYIHRLSFIKNLF